MRISGFEKIFYLTEFTLKKTCGEHGSCIFCGSVSEEDEADFLKKAGQVIQVFRREGEKEICIFSGKVDEVQISKVFNSPTVEVRATSLSASEDENSHVRIWQNPAKKFGDFLSKSKLELSDCDLKLSKSLSSLPYSRPVLQNNESNFAFLKRFSEYVNLPLWVDDTEKGKGEIVLAESLSDATFAIDSDDILRFKISKLKNNQCVMALVLKKYVPFGSKVKISDEPGEYVVSEFQMDLVHEVYEFSYKLKPYVKWKYSLAQTPQLEKTVCLKGTVENNNDEKNLGRIQLSFNDGVQDMDKERLWIPYQSPYTGLAGGIVFLPDVGDKVVVIFSNENVYATATARENALDDECRNVKEKYIGNNTKQRIFFRENELFLASGEHTVLLNDKKIEIAVGESKIILTAEKITLKQGKTEFLLTDKGSYVKACGNETALNEQGITAKSAKDIGLTSSGTINIVGNGEINIEAKSSQLSLNGSVVDIG